MERGTEEILIFGSFDRAMKLIRRAAKEEGLCISAEVPLSEIVRRQLGVGLSRCTVLLLHCPFLLLEAMVVDAGAIANLPVHVALMERGDSTVVRVPSALTAVNGLTNRTDPVAKTFERAIRAVTNAAGQSKPDCRSVRATVHPARASG